jgi:HSP20 family protein
MDNIFENFRRDIEGMMSPWSHSPLWGWRFPSELNIGARGEEEMMVRTALYDMVDKGDKYELQVEVPGIEKDKIDVKTTKDSIEISGEQSEKTEEKRKNYVYNERSYSSFYRKIPIPEEIIPSKVSAKMSNGILQVELPKKMPTKLEEEEEEATKVQIK